MDLGTVREKLLTGDYKVPNDFISDIKLIFSNAKKFNRKGSKVYLRKPSIYWLPFIYIAKIHRLNNRLEIIMLQISLILFSHFSAIILITL